MSEVILIGGGAEMIELCIEAGHEVAAVIETPADQETVLKILKAFPKSPLVLGTGRGRIRKKLIEQFQREGRVFTGAVHPEAKISPDAEIGVGAVIQYGCFISAGCQIGAFSFLNVGAAMMHDAVLKSYCVLEPRSVVMPGVVIGEGTTLEACTSANASIPSDLGG